MLTFREDADTARLACQTARDFLLRIGHRDAGEAAVPVEPQGGEDAEQQGTAPCPGRLRR